jgi:CHAT domain-containing protein/tetratricopeptide (TPR) repeat protein
MCACRFIRFLVCFVLLVTGATHQALAQGDELETLEARIPQLMIEGKWGEAVTLAERLTELVRAQKGEDHLDTARSLVTLAGLYNIQRRLTEAEPLLKRALAIREKALGPSHPDTVAILGILGPVYRALGRVADAELLEKRARQTTNRADEHAADDLKLRNEAAAHAAQGRHAEAEPLYRRAISAAEKKHGPEHSRIVHSLNPLAELYVKQGRLAEAEPLLKRALAIREKINELAELQLQTALAHETMAKINRQQGRRTEADADDKKAQDARASARNTENNFTALSMDKLAEFYVAQGRYGEAEPLLKRTLAIREKEKGAESEQAAGTVEKLAELYRAQRRYAEAEPLYKRALSLQEKKHGADTMHSLGPLGKLAEIYEGLGRYGEAEQLMLRSHAAWEKANGPEAPLTAASLVSLARFYLRAQKWPEAHQASGRATAITVKQMRREGESLQRPQSGHGQVGIDPVRRNILLGHVGVAAQVAERAPSRRAALTVDTYTAAQWALQSDAAVALAQMSARFGKGDDELGRLVRERQDLVARYRALEASWVRAIAATGDQGATASQADQAKEMAAIDSRIGATDGLLGTRFPEYASLANPEPLSIADTQALLKADEALYLVVFGDEQGFAWAITREGVQWQSIPIGTNALADKVQTLRCGLDASNWLEPARRERCTQLTGRTVSDADPLPFDLAKAHELYAALLGPFESLLRGKRLLVVPSGPLTTLPFDVLVTERPPTAIPSDPTAYERAAWLTRRHAIAMLPSVASLRALRRFARASRATSRYAGFGNPLLFGPDGNDRSAALKQACPTDLPSQTTRVAARGTPDTRIAKLVRGGLADVGRLRRVSPLPETTDELCTVARGLGAFESDLHLGAKATEAAVMALSASGALARYRIIHFATHGLLAGETEDVAQSLAEPALLLTPPDVATERDDGLLTASEVTRLKLDADWVVLSACNTASGSEKGDAEALSGLARAFFYAGARALLVSHWYVDSHAAVQLTTKAFAAMKADPGIGRAEAMRLAVLAVMSDRSRPAHWTPAAHPAVWAPFAVVGEGAH